MEWIPEGNHLHRGSIPSCYPRTAKSNHFSVFVLATLLLFLCFPVPVINSTKGNPRKDLHTIKCERACNPGHVVPQSGIFTAVRMASRITCANACINTSDCASFNFGGEKDSKGKRYCELSSLKTACTDCSTLVAKKGYQHYVCEKY